MIRPLLVTTAYPPSLGGAQLHAHELMKALARDGHDPHVATVWRRSRTDWLRGTTVRAPVDPVPTEDVDRVPVHQVTVDSRRRAALVAASFYPLLLTTGGHRQLRPRARGLFDDSLRRIVAQVQPDVLHLTRIGREHLYEAAVTVARDRGLPVVLTANHHANWDRRRDRWWWDLYRRVDAILVLGEQERGILEAGGVDPARIHRTTVGVVGTPAPRQADHPPTVTFLGQVQKHKGLDVLAAAWPAVRAAVPGARLEVVGPWLRGNDRLRRQLDDLQDAVVHGACTDDEKWAVLARTEVVAVPSSGESLGGVYLEAWAAGAVPVGADIPPVRALLEGAGRVVEREPDRLAEVLVALLADDDERARLVRAGRERLSRDHTWERIAERTLGVYRSVVHVGSD